MASRSVASSQIRLARQPGRLLAGPAVIGGTGLMMVGLGAAHAASGALLFLVPAAVGGLAVLGAGWLAGVILTARLEVDVASLRLRWLGHDQHFRLAPGALTRISVGGRGRPKLRARLGAIGWALGPATLNDESITVVRLAPGRPMVMIPTDQGRLAVAVADEREVVEVLTAAVRLQLRLDQAQARVRPVPIAVSAPPTAVAGAVLALDTAGGLTGIQREQLEERLATHRTAAVVAAESERRAASEAVRSGNYEPPRTPSPRAIAVDDTPRPSRARQRSTWHRPAWLAVATLIPRAATRPVGTPRLVTPAAAAPASPAGLASSAVAVTRTLPRVRLPSISLPSVRVPVPRWAAGRGRSLLVLAPPLLGGATWLAGSWLELLPAETEGIRILALAVILGGPVALAGSIVAWIRFPRLAGLVAVSGLLALALVGRALVG